MQKKLAALKSGPKDKSAHHKGLRKKVNAISCFVISLRACLGSECIVFSLQVLRGTASDAEQKEFAELDKTMNEITSLEAQIKQRERAARK